MSDRKKNENPSDPFDPMAAKTRDDIKIIMRFLSSSRAGLNNLQWARADRAAREVEWYLGVLETVIKNHERMTKEIDNALNGDGAAKFPTLADIVAQVQKIGPLNKIRAEEREVSDMLAKALMEHIVEGCECSNCAAGNAAIAEYRRRAK